VPSTRPRHGLGSDGSSGAYLGAARTDEPVPSDISDPDGSVVSGEARGTEPSGEGDDGGAQRQRRRRREARVSAGKSCPNFAMCLAFYHDFLCADFEMISYSGRPKLAQILNSASWSRFQFSFGSIRERNRSGSLRIFF
jgi:hypothetical protein